MKGGRIMDPKIVYFLCTGNSCRSQMQKDSVESIFQMVIWRCRPALNGMG